MSTREYRTSPAIAATAGEHSQGEAQPEAPGGAQVDSLANSFLRRTRDDVVRLKALIERAASGDWTVLNECERISHSIHGAGAMFGYLHLSKAAAAMERLVGDMLRASAPTGSAGTSDVLPLMGGAEELARALLASGRPVLAKNCMFQEPVIET